MQDKTEEGQPARLILGYRRITMAAAAPKAFGVANIRETPTVVDSERLRERAAATAAETPPGYLTDSPLIR